MNTRVLRIARELKYQFGPSDGHVVVCNLICILRGEMKDFVGMHAATARDWCQLRGIL